MGLIFGQRETRRTFCCIDLDVDKSRSTTVPCESHVDNPVSRFTEDVGVGDM